MNKKIGFALCFILLVMFWGCSKQKETTEKVVQNEFIALEEINEISILEFSSLETCKEVLNIGNKDKLKDILYLAILVSVNNIVNNSTTRTMVLHSPYKYNYIFINDLLEYNILERELFKYVYDPTHPEAIQDGEMTGYVKYPDIDIFEEQNNITRIVNILHELNK